MFLNLRQEWDVPFEVANDGDVTALAGAMSLRENGVLGVAMGSSQAAGFLDAQGRITGWLNELAFAPVDYNPLAAADEWSGDIGCGVQCFSQQAVVRLAPAAGIELPPDHPAEQLKFVQELHQKGDPRPPKIFETIGVYLGYALAHYADMYDFRHLLVLGRVTSGAGGDLIVQKAKEVLRTDFPELAQKLSLHLPDEKSKRVGQAVAAASLPSTK
jgi:predicted NBD/HSP70 family sugar kinase